MEKGEKVNHSEIFSNPKSQLILSIDSECTSLGNEILRDSHVFAALLSVSGVLDTTEWHFCRRRIASILRARLALNMHRATIEQSNSPSQPSRPPNFPTSSTSDPH